MCSSVARVFNRRSISVVAVDTRQFTTIAGIHAVDVDVALALLAAVAAGAVQLAVVLDVKVEDVDGAW